VGYRKEVVVKKWGRSKPLVEVPKEWLDYWGIKEGEKIVQLADSIIIVVPKELEGKAREILKMAQKE